MVLASDTGPSRSTPVAGAFATATAVVAASSTTPTAREILQMAEDAMQVEPASAECSVLAGCRPRSLIHIS